MKAINILLFLFLLSSINSLEACVCSVQDGTTVDECRKCYNLGSYCCLMEYTNKNNKDVKLCTTLTQSEYDNIDSTITKRLAAVEIVEGSVYGFGIDCHSYLIKFPVLTLFLLLLLNYN